MKQKRPIPYGIGLLFWRKTLASDVADESATILLLGGSSFAGGRSGFAFGAFFFLLLADDFRFGRTSFGDRSPLPLP